MKLLLRVAKNSAFLTIATLLDRAGEYILVLYISRLLGVLFFGQYHLVISMLYVFQNLANYGLIQLVTREIAKHKDRTGRLVLGYSVLGAGLSVVLTVAMYLTAVILDYPQETMTAIYLVGLSILPGALQGIGQGAIFAWERMEFVAVVRFVTSLIRVATSIALLWAGYGLLSILGALVVTQWLAALLGLIIIHRKLSPLVASVRDLHWKQEVVAVGTFFVMSIFLVGANNLDAIFLSKLATMEAVGLYGAASKLVQAIVLIRPAIMHSLFPTLSRLSQEEPIRFRKVGEQAIKLALALLLPLALTITLLAGDLVRLLYGPDFAQAVAALRVLIWLVVPSFVYAILTRVLIAGGHEKSTIAVAALSMVTNVGLDVILIPTWGPVGAAWATNISMALAMLVSWILVSRQLFKIHLWTVVGKPVLSALLLGALVVPLHDLPWPLLLILSLCVYVPILFLLRVVEPAEWLALWRALWKRLRRKGAEV
jgi:O-antigen/teichoic acid export membrane protein